MRRIWRWLCRRARSRGAGEGPESSRSSGGHEFQPEARDELHHEEGVKESKSFGQEVCQSKDFQFEARIPTVGSDSSPSHLSPGRHQPSERVDGQVFLEECHQCLRGQEKLHEDMAEMREENKSLSQQLSKAERKADGLEKEVDQLKSALLEKTSALDWTERELQKAKRQTLDWYGLCLLKDQKRADAIKKAEELQQQLAQLQSENVLLRQQLGDAQNKTAQERMVSGGASTCEADKVEKEVR
ncbi:unnamed protein product [Bubo scandiacus]